METISRPEFHPVDKIAAALAKAQAEFIHPEKNKTVTVQPREGRSYSFDYADYHAIVEAVRGPLSKNGIAFTHFLEDPNGRLNLVTQLIHTSGQTLECIWPMPSSNDPKMVGGAMTYGKRYCLSALTGCVADDDADADPQNTTEFKDRKPAVVTPARIAQAFAPAFQENDLPIETTPKTPIVKIKTANAKMDSAIAVAKAADEGKKWAGFWAGVKEHGWLPEEVHEYAENKWGVKSLTELSPEDLASLRMQIKTYAPDRKND